MKNKQILKIGRKKKIALAAMAGVMLTGAMTGTAFASNWVDTAYNFHCPAAGGSTESRAKEDAQLCLYSSSGGSWSQGSGEIQRC